MHQPSKSQLLVLIGALFIRGLRWWTHVISVLVAASFGIALTPRAQAQTIEGTLTAQNVALDSNFYTSYEFVVDRTIVDWTVSGHTKTTAGAYGSGSLGPFVKVGALLEGDPSTALSKREVTRSIYVLDIASGSSQNGVVLYVYKKIDRISSTGDKPTVTLEHKMSLPLAGGISALASMAANNNYLYIGTNQGSQGVRVTKGNFAMQLVGSVQPSVNVSSITANPYGYVSITFGDIDDAGSNCRLYGPDGSEQAYGGALLFLLNSKQAILPTDLP